MTIITEADEELLSSYLDQELSPQESSDLELRLVDEPFLRQQLAEMRGAWELLDEFPNTQLQPDFTRTTMELVALKIEREGLAKAESPIRRWTHKFGLDLPMVWFSSLPTALLWGVGCLSVALIAAGYGYANRTFARQHELRTIAVAAYLPVLQTFPDLELLKKLKTIPYWEDLLEDRSVRERMLPEPPFFDDVDQVRSWVSQLDAQQRSRLWNQHQSLLRLDMESGFKTVQHYLKVQASDDSHEYLRAGAAVTALLQTMPSNARDEILSLPADRQFARIRQAACYSLAMEHTESLSKEEKSEILKWGRTDFEERFRDAMPMRRDVVPLERLLYIILYVNPQASMTVLPDHEALITSLRNRISQKSSTLLDGVATDAQTMVMSTWLHHSGGWSEARQPADEVLYEYYAKMPPDKREGVELAQPQQGIERLTNDYRMDQNFQRNEKSLDRLQNMKGFKGRLDRMYNPRAEGKRNNLDQPSNRNEPQAPNKDEDK